MLSRRAASATGTASVTRAAPGGHLGYDSHPVGAWRSLVAHLHGVQGVASSNLVAPTNNCSENCCGQACGQVQERVPTVRSRATLSLLSGKAFW